MESIRELSFNQNVDDVFVDWEKSTNGKQNKTKQNNFISVYIIQQV